MFRYRYRYAYTGEQLGQLIYGFVDNGSKFVWNADLHDKLAAAGQALHLKPHAIQDAAGTQHTVYMNIYREISIFVNMCA